MIHALSDNTPFKGFDAVTFVVTARGVVGAVQTSGKSFTSETAA